ncbi:hypothetical protein DFH08DRAFT_824161 [Mycena albidolilacea]|uniref:Uncharacterized protein n=1 Tax=Mycena albidolilacea TaxID=1033008 RepID=A0AAD6Z539_9AGAR|nr:hypothetical protein DFH08DRAFT_824161 [Mycena albidolilacea]
MRKTLRANDGGETKERMGDSIILDANSAFRATSCIYETPLLNKVREVGKVEKIKSKTTFGGISQNGKKTEYTSWVPVEHLNTSAVLEGIRQSQNTKHTKVCRRRDQSIPSGWLRMNTGRGYTREFVPAGVRGYGCSKSNSILMLHIALHPSSRLEYFRINKVSKTVNSTVETKGPKFFGIDKILSEICRGVDTREEQKPFFAHAPTVVIIISHVIPSRQSAHSDTTEQRGQASKTTHFSELAKAVHGGILRGRGKHGMSGN